MDWPRWLDRADGASGSAGRPRPSLDSITMGINLDRTIWGIHAGRTGNAHELFMGHNVIALGWNLMPDLGTLPPDREAYKRELKLAYPDAKPGAIPVWAGQLYRFVHEMEEGDLVVYPSKHDRQIHIGRVTGPYFHVPGSADDYSQRRPVEWLTSHPRTTFSQGALYEIGSALSLFQVRNYGDEFVDVLEGKQTAPPAPKEDETIGVVAEEIEETTKDFVIKQLAKELKGHPFEEFIAELFEAIGYRTRVTQMSGDKGVDVIAHRDELGIEPPIIKIQVKSTQGTVGDPEVSQLFGKVATGEFGVMVTLGSYSRQARDFADAKGNLRLIDGDEVVRLVLDHYEQLEPRYKGLLPLRRVYVPEAIEEAGP